MLMVNIVACAQVENLCIYMFEMYDYYYQWKCNFPMTPHPFVSWSVGRSVCHNFLKGQEVTLPCSNRRTFFY